MNNRASFLDAAMVVTDSPLRPLDFAIIRTFPKAEISPEKIRNGTRLAIRNWPRSNSRFENGRWIPLTETSETRLAVENFSTSEEREEKIRRFISIPFDLRSEAPVRELFLEGPSEAVLVTRFHHALCDLVGAALWIDAQNGIVRDAGELSLKTSDRRIGKSKFAHAGPSARLWSRGNPSSDRAWHTIEFDAEKFREVAGRSGLFTYNDLLSTAALETAKAWNREKTGDDHRVSLWLPMNIRTSAFRGFGNGTSRIRIYPLPGRNSFRENCVATREQVAWGKAHGEWALPSSEALAKIPTSLLGFLFKAYFRRPWVDMGTILFSHAERTSDSGTGLHPSDIVANLIDRYPLAIAGTTRAGRTRLTFTFDPAQLTKDDVDRISAIYLSYLNEALR